MRQRGTVSRRRPARGGVAPGPIREAAPVGKALVMDLFRRVREQPAKLVEEEMNVHKVAIVIVALMAASHAMAADAGRGKRLAQERCAACHAIGPQARNEVADAPPFDVIARKYGFSADSIAFAIAGPHPKMNFSPRPAQAADIAAYISTLGR